MKRAKISPERSSNQGEQTHRERSAKIKLSLERPRVVVDGPYNKDPTLNTLGSRGVYNKFHSHFLY
jgi:hypothetical protein